MSLRFGDLTLLNSNRKGYLAVLKVGEVRHCYVAAVDNDHARDLP